MSVAHDGTTNMSCGPNANGSPLMSAVPCPSTTQYTVPSWATLRLNDTSDAVLFSYSDRPVQTAMGILREAFLE